MTVHTLDTVLQLPRPELQSLFVARARLKRLAESLSDIYLPVKGEKLISLVEELDQVERQVLNALNLIPDLLATEGLESLLQTLLTIKQQPLTQATASHVDEVAKAIRSQREQTLVALQGQAVTLRDALLNFSAVTLNDVGHLIAPIEADLAEIDAYIEAEQQPLARLIEYEAGFNTLIADLEAISLQDKLKPLSASLEQLAQIDPKNPLVGSIKAGVAGVSNMLKISAEALKYRDLIEARERLQEQLDALRGGARDAYVKRQVHAHRRDQLRQLLALEEPRAVYSREAGRILESLSQFASLNGMLGIEDVEQSTSRFIRDARLLGNYLIDVRREWRN